MDVLNALMKKNRKVLFSIIVAAIVVVCGGAGVVWWRMDGSRQKTMGDGKLIYDARWGMSIVVPSSWDGKYMMVSGPSGSVFNYVDGTTTYPLFTLYVYPDDEWNKVHQSTNLITSFASHRGFVFAYNLTPDGVFKGTLNQEKEFKNMTTLVPDILANATFSQTGLVSSSSDRLFLH